MGVGAGDPSSCPHPLQQAASSLCLRPSPTIAYSVPGDQHSICYDSAFKAGRASCRKLLWLALPPRGPAGTLPPLLPEVSVYVVWDCENALMHFLSCFLPSLSCCLFYRLATSIIFNDCATLQSVASLDCFLKYTTSVVLITADLGLKEQMILCTVNFHVRLP